ncbi:hypothetical protein QFZ23_003639 [Arthrobacter globiformis]|uniref:hypothetical protein n=1 Tax=Arthrobacter globiformis TaxID=1665 RepID=UPI00277EF222|nr:hypothetical protein [Arthrobacter globiformis]MDQ1059738.1 hypothetical protein [Arthrobacter globiformis]
MSKFWWVNQGRSFARELDMGITWAPLLTEKGRKQHHWERMDLAQPGDVVMHYAEGQIRAISRVLVGSHPASNPHAGGEWIQSGRELKLSYDVLDVAVALERLPLELRRSHSGNGSPFDRYGSVNLGYFFDLADEIGVWIMDTVGLVAGPEDKLYDLPPHGEAQNHETVIVVGPDGEITVKTRAEHHQLKSLLFKGKKESDCALCGRTLPVSLLITAHIKQRAQCSKEERVDEHVVMVACALGCDALYEKGFVSVSSDGKLMAGPKDATAPALIEHLSKLAGRTVGDFGPHNAKYYAWHRAVHAKIGGF